MSKNLVLVGFMGVGKSAVGRVLAARLKKDFVDLDVVIEEREKRPIDRIFQDSGEAYFRQVEKTVVKEFSQKESQVIACGGGAVLDKGNIGNLKQGGIIFYLKADPEAILQRTKGHQHRPLLNVADPKKKVEELLMARRPFYEQADFIVDTSKQSVDQVVEEILRAIQK
ncbi:MAG: shikimate kinase [Candidatus Omnitrophota bacterium]|nr:shikimate kinase [Candidatus Omnitrophota bacterium]